MSHLLFLMWKSVGFLLQLDLRDKGTPKKILENGRDQGLIGKQSRLRGVEPGRCIYPRHGRLNLKWKIEKKINEISWAAPLIE